jgi:hypothetical protein
MKTIAISSPLIVGGGMEGSVMGMDAAGMNTATYFMRDKIYSNKIQAVVREYACNAIDEHAKHGIDQEVEIGLRSEQNKTIFFVRDFGKGLSESDVRNVFGMYFRSTKSTTNNSIGGFGVGSKAGHCYCDTFFVASYFQGTKTTYACMLGGGDTGVPVGHIYKIDESPTNESGVEISLPVQSLDENSFNKEILKFVKFSTAKIVYNYALGSDFNHKDHRPLKTFLKKKLLDYNFRVVELDNDFTPSDVFEIEIQMGGVSYGKKSFTDGSFSVQHGFRLLVDVPIGSMSIPLSREAFENTTQNQNKINEILSLIEAWSHEDLNQFKNKNLMDLIEDAVKDNGNLYEGEVFYATMCELYKDIWHLAEKIEKCNTSAVPFSTQASKPILLSVADNSATAYWFHKIHSHCSVKNENYYTIIEGSTLTKHKDILSEHFFLKSVKSVKFDKVVQNNKIYSVYDYYQRNLGKYSALDFNNYNRRPLASIDCPIEATKINKEFVDSIDCLDDLAKITIGNLKYNGKNRSACRFYTFSVQLCEALKSIGWVEYGSKQYNETVKRITEEKAKIQRKESNVKNALKNWVDFNAKTKSIVTKNDKYAEKIATFWSKVLNEESVRGKVLLAIDQRYFYKSSSFGRQDIRNILKLK